MEETTEQLPSFACKVESKRMKCHPQDMERGVWTVYLNGEAAARVLEIPGQETVYVIYPADGDLPPTWDSYGNNDNPVYLKPFEAICEVMRRALSIEAS